MAIYVYGCEDCELSFDVNLPIKDYSRDRIQECIFCGGKNTKRVIGASAVHFGPGFFKDGYQSAKNVKRNEE